MDCTPTALFVVFRAAVVVSDKFWPLRKNLKPLTDVSATVPENCTAGRALKFNVPLPAVNGARH